MFPVRHVIASPAYLGPGGGWSGGVAIIVPQDYDVVRTQVAVPGCVIAVTLRQGEETFRLVSVYLPPDRRQEVLADAADALDDAPGVNTFWGGDINMQWRDPRDGEVEDVATWTSLIARHGSYAAAMDGPTRIDRFGESQIDAIACPATLSGLYRTSKAWKISLSDHALVYADPCTKVSTRRDDVLTPWAYKTLPGEAHDDLRRRYILLEQMFQVPQVDLSGLTQAADWTRPAVPGDMGGAHPSLDMGDHADDEQANDDPVPPITDQAPPWLPALAAHGRDALTSVLRSWWKYWGRKQRIRSPGSVLLRASRGSVPLTPAGPLASWLTNAGWTGQALSPAEAAAWHVHWTAEQRQRRAALLTPWQRGAGVERAQLAPHFRIGKEIFKKAHSLRGVRDEGGTWHERSSDVERVLWESRSSIWQSVPPLPAAMVRLLDSYFAEGRRADLPARPLPKWGRLAALVLSPSGSAPGIDGEPYEVYHAGARFVACLLAQAWYLADEDPDRLEDILGPSVDLLVWILKAPDAERPNDLRPLQLPSCFRRLFGASLADLVGPIVEPQLSQDQAAKKGGTCGPNITCATEHLAQEPSRNPPPGPGADAFLGRYAGVVRDYIAHVTQGLGPSPATAVLFADQSKAFERLSLQFLAHLLRRWGLPVWVQHALLSLVAQRDVQTCKGPYVGPKRRLLRSIGMGGTASPLLWCMAYDPVIEAITAAAGDRCPTYVDDLAALLTTAEQALRASIMLPWASFAAGLLVESHTCRGLVVPAQPPGLQDLCDRLPVTLSRTDAGLPLVVGLVPDLVKRLIEHDLGADAVAGAWIWQTQCRCKFKTALVPAGGQEWWKAVMSTSSFGASCVRLMWPYLGAMVAARTSDDTPPRRGGMTASQVDAMIAGTWGKAMGKMRTRSLTLHDAHASPGRRAAVWNAYIASLVPYPAQYTPASPAIERSMRAHLRTAIGLAGTHWVPDFVLTGLGLRYQVPGCPKCPVSLGRGLAALAHARGEVWGPRPARRRALTRWNKLTRWAQGQPTLPCPRSRSNVLTPSKAAAIIAAHTQRPDLPRGRRLGRALYVAAWSQQHGHTLDTWFAAASARRRWAQGDGSEWDILAATADFTAAYHVVRVMANGLPGHARWRTAADRFPHQCTVCRCQADAVWHTASATTPGTAWCHGCLGGWGAGVAKWPLLPDDQLPQPLQDQAAIYRHRCPPPAIQVPLDPSPYGCCPLCGLGEASAEHIWMWCPAVALAWLLVRPDDAPTLLPDAILQPGSHKKLLALFLHQTSYRYCVALGRAPLTAAEAARLIRSGMVVDRLQDDLPAPDEEFTVPGDDVDGVWTRAADHCPQCLPHGPTARAVHGSASLHGTRTADRAGGDCRRLLAAGRHIQDGEALLQLRSTHAQGGWLQAGPGWVPCPRVHSDFSATWHHSFCRSCCQHCLTLIATTNLDPGQEVVVRTSPFPDQDRSMWPYEVTFDGGARSFLDRDKVAGAGATLWRHDPVGGPPSRIASTIVAIPCSDSAQVGETSGCRAGLGLLDCLSDTETSARIVGDNLAAVRYGAGTGRYRRLHLCAQMDQGLRPLAAKGWRLAWQAVRRRLNKAADTLATLGVYWADRLKQAGHTAVATWTVWHGSASTATPTLFPDPSLGGLPTERLAEAVEQLEAETARLTRLHRQNA